MSRLYLITLVLFSAIPHLLCGQDDRTPSIETFNVPSSIRALEVIDSKTIWFAGSSGVYGHTYDGGQTWTVDSLRHEDVPELQFRSIAATSSSVFLLSIGTPALLYRTDDRGANWEVVYREDHEKVFYDAMDFWDDETGIAMGDPVTDCLSVIITRDGGDTWSKISCEQLPSTVDSEAAFAASNSNIALYGDRAWLVTGGSKSRVFHSADRGTSWEVSDTPIVAGGQMTGIYSIDFYDQNQGIIFGGDWNQKERSQANKAITLDGGKTWSLVSDGSGPGYRSCVQYVPGTGGKKLLAVGSPGMSISHDGGQTWSSINDFASYTVRFASRDTAWIAGNGFIGKMTFD